MTARIESSAYEIEQFNYSQSEKIVSIKKKRLEREKAKKKAFNQVVNLFCSVAIVLVFAVIFGSIIFQNSLVNEAKYDIFNLKAEIKSLNAKVEEMNAKIENHTELNNIERIATEELNMQYPSKEQLVYIDSNYNYALETPKFQTAEGSDVGTGNSSDQLVHDLVLALFRTNN
jgi:cell division protein FtsL